MVECPEHQRSVKMLSVRKRVRVCGPTAGMGQLLVITDKPDNEVFSAITGPGLCLHFLCPRAGVPRTVEGHLDLSVKYPHLLDAESKFSRQLGRENRQS